MMIEMKPEIITRSAPIRVQKQRRAWREMFPVARDLLKRLHPVSNRIAVSIWREKNRAILERGGQLAWYAFAVEECARLREKRFEVERVARQYGIGAFEDECYFVSLDKGQKCEP